MDIYDTATGAWETAALSSGRNVLAGAGLSDRALFAGGWDGYHRMAVVDVFIVPEPAALSLLAIGGLAVIRRRRK